MKSGVNTELPATCTWEELARRIEDKYQVKRSPDSLRKWTDRHVLGKAHNGRTNGEVFTPMTTDEVVEQVAPEPTDADLARELAHDRRASRDAATISILRRKLRMLQDEQAVEDPFREMLDKYLSTFDIPRLKALGNTESPKKAKIEETMVVLLSDWHVGETVAYEAMHGTNVYDIRVATARVEELIRRIIDICFGALKGYRFPVLKVYCLGDLINGMFGAMHDELVVTQSADLWDTVFGTAGLLAQFIAHMLEYFDRIDVCAAPGNHGRMQKKPWAKGQHVNWDMMIPNIVSGKFAGNKRVTWNIPRSFFFLDEVEGQQFLGLHGHQVKGWASIPWYGINRTVGNLTDLIDNRRASAVAETIRAGGEVDLKSLTSLRINNVVMGHFHTEAVFDRLNGEVVAAPCFPHDTPITLRDGTRVPIGEIGQGDVVLTHSGNYQKVTKVMRRPFTGQLVGWRLGTLASETRCTPEHPIRAIKGSGIPHALPRGGSWESSDAALTPEWVEARYLSVGDYVQVARPTPVPGRTMDPTEARAWGLFLAEGSLSPYRPGGRLGHVSWTFHQREEDLAATVKRWCDSMGWKWSERVRPENHVRKVRVSSVEAADYLFTRMGKGAGEKRLTREIMDLPVEDKREILLGWVAGDGHVNHKNRRGGRLVSATSISKALIEQMYQIATECGYAPTLFTLSAGGPRKRDSYTLGFGGRDAAELAELLGDPLTGDDGHPSTVWVEGQVYRKVEDVWRETWAGDVFNLEVQNDHSYVANGVAVHNCLKGSDEFSLSAGFKPARAGQTMFGVHRDHGITSRWRVDLQDATEPTGLLTWNPGGTLAESWA